MSSGSEGQYTAVTSTGGSTAFRTVSDTAVITVTGINDGPTFAPVAGTGELILSVGSGNDFSVGQNLAVMPMAS